MSDVPAETWPNLHLTRRQRSLLLLAAALSSSCGLAIELLLGTLASYLVGNQALAYGVSVGGFLAAMGVGAYLTRFIAADSDRMLPTEPSVSEFSQLREIQRQQLQLQRVFIWIELLMAPLSALLPLGLFALFVIDGPFWLGLALVTIVLGVLAGMELPLLTRLLEKDEGLREALAGVLALDYLGALVGSLAFPIVLLPWVGLFPSAALIATLPAFMSFALGRAFPKLHRWGNLGLLLGVLLCLLAPLTIPLSDRLENTLYKAPVVTRIQSPYQRVVLTRQGADLRLFLDGDLQFSTLDEYRYHEALVHPAMSANLLLRQSATPEPPLLRKDAQGRDRKVLLLGAGDGMALREVLKWPDVQRVVLIDLDRAVVDLARHHPFLVNLNQQAFADPRVQFIQADAFVRAPALPEQFDVILADFPDPDRDILAKLYAQGFYQRLMTRLAPDGIFVTQASSPFFAPRAFACIDATLRSLNLSVYPYVMDVPSFGPWGFVMATRKAVPLEQLTLPISTRFLNQATLHNLFSLPKDIELGNVEINRLAHPVIVRYQADARWAAYD